MSEKRFKVEISFDNYVHFIENGVNVISIGFKEYADAESCKYSLLPFCNRLNELEDENQELNNLKNLCRDYNIKLEDIYDIVEKAIEGE